MTVLRSRVQSEVCIWNTNNWIIFVSASLKYKLLSLYVEMKQDFMNWNHNQFTKWSHLCWQQLFLSSLLRHVIVEGRLPDLTLFILRSLVTGVAVAESSAMVRWTLMSALPQVETTLTMVGWPADPRSGMEAMAWAPRPCSSLQTLVQSLRSGL